MNRAIIEVTEPALDVLIISGFFLLFEAMSKPFLFLWKIGASCTLTAMFSRGSMVGLGSRIVPCLCFLNFFWILLIFWKIVLETFLGLVGLGQRSSITFPIGVVVVDGMWVDIVIIGGFSSALSLGALSISSFSWDSKLSTFFSSTWGFFPGLFSAL